MSTENGEIKPTLGLLSATTLIMGSAIGSGIFLLPAAMGAQVGSPGLLLLVWVICGLLSLCGALTFAELAGMFPRQGGQYTFLKESFGPKTAFLYGWIYFWALEAGIIAAVAVAFARYLGVLFPYAGFDLGPLAFTPALVQNLVAMVAIALLTVVNALGVRYGGAVQNVFTILKVAAIVGIALAALFSAGAGSVLTPFAPANAGGGLVAAFGLAMLSAFFAYDGWNQAAFVAGEIKDPQRTVPKAMLLGTLGVMAVYVSVTAAYLYVLPFADLTASPTLAADVMRAIAGPVGAAAVATAVVVSTFGTVNAYVLAGPRVYYAMAKDGLFYRSFARLSKRFATPTFGLLIQAEAACLLVLSGSYNDIVNYTVFSAWLAYGITGVGYFLLRAKRPDHPRPYKTTGYPVVPALFVATSAFIVVNTLFYDTRNALIGLLIVATGVPFAFYLTRKSALRAESTMTPEAASPP